MIVGFSRPLTFKPFAEVIMLADRTNFSHTYIKLYSQKLDCTFIFQASGSNVNIMNSEVFEAHNKIVEEIAIPISEETRLQILKFAFQQLGKPYSLKQILGITIFRLASLVGIRLRNLFADDDESFVCSELVGDVIRKFINPTYDPNLEIISPKDILVYLESTYGKTNP